MERQINHASLFTGIGGFDLAAEWMGWNNVFQVEIDKFCTKVLEKNFPNAKRYGDIKQFDGKPYRGTIDVLTGGFPCQNISISNQKDGVGITGTKSILWFEYARIIREINPRFVIIENSPQLLRKGFEEVLFSLSESGYNAQWDCVQAIPFRGHQRNRLYVVAYPKCIGRIQASLFKGVWEEIYSYRPSSGDNIFIEDIGRSYPNVPKDLCLDDGVSYSLDETICSLHGYGNSIAPQIAKKIFQEIKALNL